MMLAAAAVVGLLWLSDILTVRSPEQQLAAIEAARAIPDEQNAAVIYKRLFEDWTARNASVDMEKRLGAEAIIFEPWSSEEYPEADAFLETEQRTMRLLREACEKRKCWFGLPANVNALGRMDTIYMTMLRYQLSALQRLKRIISGLRDKSEVREKAGEIYLRLLAHRCGIRILIALRRYKNEHGFWPRGLDDTKGITPAEAFIDPRNEGSFVYRLTDGGFELYSKGPNKIDEEGKFKDGADDWCIWPPAGSKIKMEEANAS
jgi:hypothetical protein